MEATNGEMMHLSAEEVAQWSTAYERGSFLYKPYPGSPHWGVTIIPEAYLFAHWTKHFEILEIGHFYQNWTQIPILLRRK